VVIGISAYLMLTVRDELSCEGWFSRCCCGSLVLLVQAGVLMEVLVMAFVGSHNLPFLWRRNRQSSVLPYSSIRCIGLEDAHLHPLIET